MIYLIIGTVAQKYVGLYEATHIFFSSLILWAGPFPLPGLPLILAIISINLAGKLIFKSPWSVRNSGIIITHIGALLLLVGGLITAAFSEEGYLDIPVGQTRNIVSDYHDREFVILDQNDQTISSYSPSQLRSGEVIKNLPFQITITDVCRHCAIEKRTDADESFHGMAQHMQLKPAPLKMQNEENMGGITFAINGTTPETDGTYVVIEDIPKLPEFNVSNKIYKIALRKKQRILPFDIELLSFKREVYPGTDKPKAYESIVKIHDNGVEWQASISMNEPLRYKGYTFFQSSFISTPNGDVSVFAVVWNVGRTFPYIASITMGIGILLHLILRGRRR